jgi:hypothetical protein
MPDVCDLLADARKLAVLSRILEKPPVAQLLKKFPTFMQPEGSLRVHQRPPLVPILSQINPVHTTPSYLSSILHEDLTNQLHGAEPFLRNRQLISVYSRTSQHFIQPEGLLPSSQEPSTGPCPEPDELSPYQPILFS